MTLPLSGFLTGSGGGAAGGTGDVVGPAASLDGQVAVFDGITGKLLSASAATLTAAGTLVIPAAQAVVAPKFALNGLTAASPALVESTSGLADSLVAVLADGSVYTGIQAQAFQISGLATIQGSTDVYLSTTGSPSAFATFRHAKMVTASTAGSGAPKVLAWYEVGGNVWTNEGAGAAAYFTLPTAIAGSWIRFAVQDADGVRIVAGGGDTIRVIDKVTAAAGYLESTTIGSVVLLEAINATEWFAMSIHGVWTDGTFTYDDTSLTTP